MPTIDLVKRNQTAEVFHCLALFTDLSIAEVVVEHEQHISRFA